jgi:hypothetical protein
MSTRFPTISHDESSTASSIAALPACWLARSDDLRRHAAEGAACAYEYAANELAKALQLQVEACLTMKDAARVSGFSAEHLARLVREGKLPNAGRLGRPRVRVGDLPQKRPAIAAKLAPLYDPVTDARALVSRR